MVDEAIEIGADAIILGLPYRKRFGGDFAIGGTISYVFQNAPCEVIVVREPMPSVTKVETPAPVEKVAAKVGAESSSGSGRIKQHERLRSARRLELPQQIAWQRPQGPGGWRLITQCEQ